MVMPFKKVIFWYDGVVHVVAPLLHRNEKMSIPQSTFPIKPLISSQRKIKKKKNNYQIKIKNY